jgi:hypothetical protein
MSILLAALVTHAQHPYLGALILIGLGSLLFLGGLQNYRKYRILADAPRAHVRSMAMGLVHLRGKATGEPLISPLTGTHCFAYICSIQSYVKTRSGGKSKWAWQTVIGDDDIKWFYLDDGTGRVRVNPLQPEVSNLNLQRTFYCEIGKDGRFRSVQPTPGFPAPTEQDVWNYTQGAHSRKLLEHVFEMQGERGKKMKAVMETTMKVLGGAQKVESMVPTLEISWSSNAGNLRVIEECFLAESDCVVMGTCAENPEAKSEEDRIVICQGENEKTFIISTQPEVQLGRSMRRDSLIEFLLAVALIVGGFALALHGGGLL